MTKRRDDFSTQVIRQVEREVRATCTVCGRPTVGPAAEPGRFINLGTAAHITAASAGGPRYDSSLTTEDRRSSHNAIHTCRDCGKLVDDDTSTFSVDLLHYLKAAALSRARHAVVTGDTEP